jgi:hypothetical protein
MVDKSTLEVCDVVDSIRPCSKRATWFSIRPCSKRTTWLIQYARARSARRGWFSTPMLEARDVDSSIQRRPCSKHVKYSIEYSDIRVRST